MNKEKLILAGVDYDSGFARCVNNAELYERLLTAFASNNERYNRMCELFSQKNYKELQLVVHELKGVSGNLSIIPIFELSMKLMEMLRVGSPEVNDAFFQFANVYETTVKAILDSKGD